MQFEDAQNETTFQFDAFDLADRMLREPVSPPSRPKDFGSYHFLEDRPRGQGSLGDVWLAEDVGKGRRVAIKFLRSVPPELADNEVKAQARLEHRYIARLYGHGVLDDGTPWLEMEFVDGKPLGEYCKNCTIASRLAIFHAICEAVQYAHSEKVDHGDLKPANILVKENGEPKLVDFGLARRLYGHSGAADRAPVAGLTPAYAAPEQFRAESPGFRSDIYSLGIILYELLSGTLPFDPATHTLTEMAVLKSARQAPEPPSAAANRAGLGRELSGSQWRDLDALCLKAMESDVLERYQSVQSLLQDLDRYLRCEPLLARMPFPRGYRATRFLRRNRGWVSAASLMFVLIAGLVTFFTLRLAKERDRALAEAERTRRIQQFMLDLFGEEDQTAAPSKDLTVIAAADRWAAGLPTLKSDPETESELYETLGRVYEQLHQMPKAEKFLEAGVEKARTLGPGSPLVIDAMVQLGLLRGDQAQYAEAERLLREAVDLAGRMHLPADNPRLMNTQISLGRVLVQGGAYEKGVNILEPIVNRPPSGVEQTINVLEGLTALGVAEQYLGHYDRAEAANRRALDLDRKLHGDSHPRVATDLANIATTEMTLGRYPQAEDLYRQAVAILERRYGPANVVALQIKSFIAVAEMRSGNPIEAQKLLHDLVPIEEKAYGTSVHPTVAFAHQTLGNLAESRHNLAEAESEYRQALEINRKLYGPDQYLTAIAATNLAGAVLQEGRYGEAETIARPAVKTLTARPMPGNMSVGVAQHNLGESILKQKRYQEAVGPLAAAYEYLKNLPGVPKDRMDRLRADLLEAYDALKQPDLAAAIRSGQSTVTGR